MANAGVIPDLRRIKGDCNLSETPAIVYFLLTRYDKAAAEKLVLEANSDAMATCALRPSVLCGPGDPQLLPPIYACIAKWETPFVIGNGTNLWDVTYVTNIADAHVLAAENLISSQTASGEAFFIQNNEPIAFRDFCVAIWAQFGHVPPFEIHIPQSLALLAGWVCETLTWLTGSTTTLSRGSVGDACAVRYASGEKAKRILGYEARVGMEEAIRLSCEVSSAPYPSWGSLIDQINLLFTACRTMRVVKASCCQPVPLRRSNNNECEYAPHVIPDCE